MAQLLRRLGLYLGLAFALASLVALLSFAPQDPTFTNLRFPKDGIGNWLGYPGALVAGSLAEALGWAALLLPCAVLYWLLCTAGRPRIWLYILQTGALMLTAAAWTGQWADTPGLGLASPGLVGWAAGRWTRDVLGSGFGGALLTCALILSLWHQLYAPQWRAAVRDVRTLGRLFTIEGWRMGWASLRVSAQRIPWNSAGMLLLAPAGAMLWAGTALGIGLKRGIGAPLARILTAFRSGSASLRRIKVRAATVSARRQPANPEAGSASRESGKAFDAWMEPDPFPEDGAPLLAKYESRNRSIAPGSALANASDSARRAPPPTGAERLAEQSRVARDMQAEQPAAQPKPRPEFPPAGTGAERWEQLLRRYRDNLDLDWDEHRWRSKNDEGDKAPDAPEGRTPKR